MLAQSVIVPRSRWAPPTLLRVGTCLGAMGFALLAVDGGLVIIVISVTMIGMGIGITTPGYTAGPTLLMSRTAPTAARAGGTSALRDWARKVATVDSGGRMIGSVVIRPPAV